MEQLELEIETSQQQELGLVEKVREARIRVVTADHHYGSSYCGHCDYKLPERIPSACPECDYTLKGIYHQPGFGGSDF